MVNPNAYCGLCAYCRAGDLVRCENLLAVGVNRDGMFAEYVSVPVGQVFDADGLEPDTAVFAEPASCAMHGLERLRPRPGTQRAGLRRRPDRLAAGPADGLRRRRPRDRRRPGAGQARHRRGAGHRPDHRRSTGSPTTTPSRSLDRLRAASPTGDGYDIVVEATGSVTVGDLGLPLLRNGGTLLVYGVAREDARLALSPYEIFRRELTVMGSFAEMTSFAAALAALRSGRVRTDGIITHRFGLADYAKAIDAAQHDGTTHKIVIVP